MANPEHLKILEQGVEVWNEWRKENLTLRPDLLRVDLSGKNLRGIYLNACELMGSFFQGADLTGSALNHSNLSGADLRNVKLVNCNLNRINFTEANLSGTSVHHSMLSWTIFFSTNLSDVRGLNTIQHYGPCSIDHLTLKNSGELPPSFLRGIGLPDTYIKYIPSLFHGDAIEYYSCFISYSSTNEDFAKRLHADLQDNGVRCWFTPEDMKIGDKVRHTIDSAIRLHDKLILILSETSIESDWVEHEVNQALEREERDSSLVLFPIRIDDAVMDTGFGWAKRLREAHRPAGRHIGDFTEWKNHDSYQKAFERLLRDLKT